MSLPKPYIRDLFWLVLVVSCVPVEVALTKSWNSAVVTLKSPCILPPTAALLLHTREVSTRKSQGTLTGLGPLWCSSPSRSSLFCWPWRGERSSCGDAPVANQRKLDLCLRTLTNRPTGSLQLRQKLCQRPGNCSARSSSMPQRQPL